jgi:hypothetical protein
MTQPKFRKLCEMIEVISHQNMPGYTVRPPGHRNLLSETAAAMGFHAMDPNTYCELEAMRRPNASASLLEI